LNDRLHNHLASIVAKELNIEPASLNDRLRSQIPSWDSLKHLELILRLEEQFQVRFSSKEVAEIQSLDDLLRLIEAKS
jgi:acyl carrier protein